MSAQLASIKAPARRADEHEAELKAKEGAWKDSSILTELGMLELKRKFSVAATETNSPRIPGQDRVAAPTRDAGTTMQTHMRPEMACTPETLREQERAEARSRDQNESVLLDGKDSVPPRLLSNTGFVRKQIDHLEHLDRSDSD